jgi:hypothetical protein
MQEYTKPPGTITFAWDYPASEPSVDRFEQALFLDAALTNRLSLQTTMGAATRQFTISFGTGGSTVDQVYYVVVRAGTATATRSAWSDPIKLTITQSATVTAIPVAPTNLRIV